MSKMPVAKKPTRQKSTMKGIYTPINTHKYLGDPRNITYRSSWELRFLHFCDHNPSVIRFGSEEIKIQYWNPVRKRKAMYITDFVIQYKRDDKLITEVIEIKPSKEAILRPKMSDYDKVCLAINTCKWQAARIFCDKYDMVFRIITEKGSMTVDHQGQPIPLTDQGLFRT